MLISKTTFLEFQMCPKNTWLKLHRPDLLHQFTLSEFELHLVEQGNEVEAFARNLWPGGVSVALGGEEGCRETERLMALRVPANPVVSFSPRARSSEPHAHDTPSPRARISLTRPQPSHHRFCVEPSGAGRRRPDAGYLWGRHSPRT